MLEALVKDYQTQPRVPSGNGRTSGQWTSDGGADGGTSAAPASTAAGGHPWGVGADARAGLRANLLPVKYDSRDTTGLLRPPAIEVPAEVMAPTAARTWLFGLTAAQLIQLGLYAARFGGPAAALSTLFIPTNKSLRQEGTIPGWPPIQYLWHSDQRSLVLSYLGPNWRRVTKTAELGKNGYFRDVDGKVIGRVLPNGYLAIDRSAIFPEEARGKDEPNLCKAPEPDKDHKNVNGLLFENYMKPLINPGNPTPSGFGVKLFNPASGEFVYFDDCQRRSGVLFEYKGVKYVDLLGSSFKDSPMRKLVNQATNQVNAAGKDPIIWVFAEEAAREAVEEEFKLHANLRGRIQLISMPWKPG